MSIYDIHQLDRVFREDVKTFRDLPSTKAHEIQDEQKVALKGAAEAITREVLQGEGRMNRAKAEEV